MESWVSKEVFLALHDLFMIRLTLREDHEKLGRKGVV
jgi:hypothetical protein